MRARAIAYRLRPSAILCDLSVRTSPNVPPRGAYVGYQGCPPHTPATQACTLRALRRARARLREIQGTLESEVTAGPVPTSRFRPALLVSDAHLSRVLYHGYPLSASRSTIVALIMNAYHREPGTSSAADRLSQENPHSSSQSTCLISAHPRCESQSDSLAQVDGRLQIFQISRLQGVLLCSRCRRRQDVLLRAPSPARRRRQRTIVQRSGHTSGQPILTCAVSASRLVSLAGRCLHAHAHGLASNLNGSETEADPQTGTSTVGVAGRKHDAIDRRACMHARATALGTERMPRLDLKLSRLLGEPVQDGSGGHLLGQTVMPVCA